MHYSRIINIIKSRLSDLSRVEAIVAKLFMIFFGRRICIDNEHSLSTLPDPVVYVFNHNSYFETLAVYVCLLFIRGSKKISFLVDWMFAHVPVIGWLLKRSNPIYVRNKRSRFKILGKKKSIARENSMMESLRALAGVRSIGIFPEGKANRNLLFLLKGKRGIGYIVLHSGATVVPIGIDFKERLTRGRIPAVGHMILHVGTPLAFSGFTAVDLGASDARRNEQEKKCAAYITDVVMRNLALLCGKEYPYRESEIYRHLKTEQNYRFADRRRSGNPRR